MSNWLRTKAMIANWDNQIDYYFRFRAIDRYNPVWDEFCNWYINLIAPNATVWVRSRIRRGLNAHADHRTIFINTVRPSALVYFGFSGQEFKEQELDRYTMHIVDEYMKYACKKRFSIDEPLADILSI